MIIDFFQRVRHIDDLIRLRSCKTPKQMAQKVGIAQRTLYIYLALMKEMGAPIAYNRTDGYHYTEEGNFVVEFQTK